MTDETDNLVLILLRDIRATLDEQTKLHAGHTERFDRLEQRMDDLYESTYSALGFAAHANIRIDSVGERPKKLESRVSRLEDDRV